MGKELWINVPSVVDSISGKLTFSLATTLCNIHILNSESSYSQFSF